MARKLGTNSRQIRRWKTHGTTLDAFGPLASLLECKPEDLIDPGPDDLDLFEFGYDRLVELEKQIPDGGGIAIVASVPFREAVDLKILDLMKERLQAGVHITYFYAVKDSTQIQDPCSADGMLQSVRHVRNELRDLNVKGRLYGFLFDNRQAQLVTAHTILVMFSNDVSQQLPDHIFQYTQCSTLSSGRTAEIWLRLDPGHSNGNYAEICGRLQRCAEPMPWLGLYEDNLQSEVQEDYQRLLEDATFSGIYDELRSSISTNYEQNGSLYEQLPEAALEAISQDLGQPLAILDVGIGDGLVGSCVVETLLSKALVPTRTPVEWHCVDSARPIFMTRLMQYLRGTIEALDLQDKPKCLAAIERLRSFDRLTIDHHHVTFEQYRGPPAGFDIILMIHSLYLIDCSQLNKALFLLRESGVLVLVIAPSEPNALNRVCREVDLSLAERYRSPSKASHKVIPDPFRNYAEDVIEYCQKVLRTEPDVRRLALPSARIASDSATLRHLENAARFFVGKLDLSPNEVSSIVNRIYNESVSGLTAGQSPDEETLIVLTKRQLCDSIRIWPASASRQTS